MASTMAVPSLCMRSASQGGTRPPCRGRSAKPERFMLQIVMDARVTGGRSRRLHRSKDAGAGMDSGLLEVQRHAFERCTVDLRDTAFVDSEFIADFAHGFFPYVVEADHG